MDDIERIEVISGPGATLWGANAMNGVINIITRNGVGNRRAALVRLDAGDQRAGRGAALRRQRAATMARSACMPSGSTAAPREIRRRRTAPRTTGTSCRRDSAWIPDAARTASRCRAIYQTARAGIRGCQRCRHSRGANLLGRWEHAGDRVDDAHAGLSSIASIASARRPGWRSTSTPTTSISSRAPMSARGISSSGAWAGATTTTTPSTTTWHSCPITARSSSPMSSCRTRSR